MTVAIPCCVILAGVEENPYETPIEQPQPSRQEQGQIPLLYLGPIVAEFSYVVSFVALALLPWAREEGSGVRWLVVPLGDLMSAPPFSVAAMVVHFGAGFATHVVFWWLAIAAFRWAVGHYSR